MAKLGKYTLVVIGGEQIAAQMDSALSFEQALIEITGTGSLNRFKNFDFDERTMSGSFSVHQSDSIEDLFWNYYYQAQRITIYYGGIENGDKYYQFSAIMTKIDRSDPTAGISMLSISFTVDGEPQRLTVSESLVFWNLILNAYGDGSISANPDYTEYADGSSVAISASANSGSLFYALRTGSSFNFDNPLNITMDADKTVDAFIGKTEFDYVFDTNSGDDWTFDPSYPSLDFTITYESDGVNISVTNNSGTSKPIGRSIRYNIPNYLLFNYISAYFDIISANGNFILRFFFNDPVTSSYISSENTSDFSTSNEPYKLFSYSQTYFATSIHIVSTYTIADGETVNFKISRIKAGLI